MDISCCAPQPFSSLSRIFTYAKDYDIYALGRCEAWKEDIRSFGDFLGDRYGSEGKCSRPIARYAVDALKSRCERPFADSGLG